MKIGMWVSIRLVLTALLSLTAARPLVAETMLQRIAGLAPGHWIEVTSNAAGTIRDTKLSRVYPPKKIRAAGNPWSIMGAWSGGAYAPEQHKLMVFGGGHNDYGGNEVYMFDLDRLEWQRVTNPSRYDEHRQTLDGTPRARHSYDGIEWLPRLRKFIVAGGAPWKVSGGGSRGTWLFDPVTDKWQRRASMPVEAGSTMMAVDNATGLVYATSGYDMLRYDPADNRWTDLGYFHGFPEGTADIDSKRHRLVMLNESGLRVSTNLAFPKFGLSGYLKLKGDAPEHPASCGLAYDLRRDSFLAWNGGRTVWEMDAGTLTWRKHATADGPAPVEFHTHGVYGRWRYVPHLDEFIGVNGTNDNVWFYKPPRRP